jgi:phage gp45-like
MNPRPPTMSEAERAAVMQAFRGRLLKQTDGLITGAGRTGQQLADVHACSPYGLRSYPPQDHELVYMQTEGGLVVVAQREDATDYAGYGLSEPVEGEVVLYSNQGASLKLDKDGGIVAEPKSGQHVKLGDEAALAVALDTDPAVGTTAFVTWLNGVAAAAGYAPPWTASADMTNIKASASKVKGE